MNTIKKAAASMAAVAVTASALMFTASAPAEARFVCQYVPTWGSYYCDWFSGD